MVLVYFVMVALMLRRSMYVFQVTEGYAESEELGDIRRLQEVWTIHCRSNVVVVGGRVLEHHWQEV